VKGNKSPSFLSDHACTLLLLFTILSVLYHLYQGFEVVKGCKSRLIIIVKLSRGVFALLIRSVRSLSLDCAVPRPTKAQQLLVDFHSFAGTWTLSSVPSEKSE
jgi:hypothetical protein